MPKHFNAECQEIYTKSDLTPALRELWPDDLVFIEFDQCNKFKGFRSEPHGVTWSIVVKTRNSRDLAELNFTFYYIKTSQNIRKQQIKQVLEHFKMQNEYYKTQEEPSALSAN